MTADRSGDEPAEIAGLGPAQWALFAGYGAAVTRRRASLSIPWPAHAAWSPTELTAALPDRFDALGLAVVALPGFQVPVLRAGAPVRWYEQDQEPADGGGTVLQWCAEGDPVTGGRWLRLDAPTAVLDATSWRLLWSWLRPAAAGARPPVGPAEIGFLDVLEWQHEEAERARPDGYGSAFRTLLDLAPGAGPATTPGGGPVESGYAWYRCGAGLLDRAAELAARLSCDVEDVVATALALALPYGGEDDPVPVSRMLDGRFVADLEPVVGRLDLLAPVTVALPRGAAAVAAVAATAEAAARARERYARDTHAVAVSVLDALGRRQRTGAPVAAVVSGPGLEPLSGPGGTPLWPRLRDDPGPADLLVQITPDGPDAGVHLRHIPGRPLVEPRFLAERLDTVLRQLATGGRSVTTMSRTGPAEREWLRRRLSGGGSRTPLRPIHAAILDHALSTPERCAIEEPERSVSYGALRAAALATASGLRAAGVRRGDLVAVDAGRLAPFVTGCLAVMLCGAAFLPIDLSAPALRRRQLLRRAGARLVLTDPARPAGDPAGGVSIPIHDAEQPRGEAESGVEVAAGAGHEDLAYAMFTSGSTGTPNPVGVTHQALAAYAGAIAPRLRLVPGTRSASPAAPTADLPFTALWPTLAGGGTVVEIPPESRLDAAMFAQAVGGRQVEVLKIAPSHLAALLDSEQAAGCLPSRLLVLGGERLTSDLVGRIRRLRPDIEIVNHYGPTEATVGVLTGAVALQAGPVDPPLGLPLPHADVAVLGPDGDLAAVGQPGELVIGGAGLAIGYLGEPRLTAWRFRPAPGGPAGARLYHTGDLARVGASGEVAYLGRLDGQVKVRGWRVEPGEIEHAMRQHPDVTQACVVTAPVESGGALVGFATGGGRLTEAGLIAHLRDRLPDALVPSRVELLTDLPLLPNGKADREVLRRRAGDSARVVTTARDDVERVLAAVWCELIGVPEIDVTVDLFQAGAHSLLATRALTRLREMLGVPLRLEAFFEQPTIERFAAHLRGGPHGAEATRRAAVAARMLRMTDAELAELASRKQEVSRP